MLFLLAFILTKYNKCEKYSSKILLFLHYTYSYLQSLSHYNTGLPSDIEHFMNCGADKVLLKPLDMTAFAEAIKETREIML